MYREIIALKAIVVVDAILATLTFVGTILSQPALTDIRHGEVDLAAAVQVTETAEFVGTDVDPAVADTRLAVDVTFANASSIRITRIHAG